MRFETAFRYDLSDGFEHVWVLELFSGALARARIRLLTSHICYYSALANFFLCADLDAV